MSATQEQIELMLNRAEIEKALHEDWKRRQSGLKGVSVTRIPLTEEEKEDKIRRFNAIIEVENKLEAARLAEKSRREAQEQKLKDEWGYDAFLRLMRNNSLKRGNKLIENKDTLNLIKLICFRLSGNQRYETELGLSFSKGLIIQGRPGLGKTYLWELVAENPVNKVQIISMHDIVKDVKDYGDFTGVKWLTYDMVLIDDAGTEYFGDNSIKFYGTEVNWLKTFIETTYAKKKEVLNRLIITTNDTADELGKKYGFRVRDRMAEVFDVVTVTGESMRRK